MTRQAEFALALRCRSGVILPVDGAMIWFKSIERVLDQLAKEDCLSPISSLKSQLTSS